VLPQPLEPVEQTEPSAARNLYPAAEDRRAGTLRTLRHLGALAIQAVVLAALLLLFFLRVPQVDGHSMAPQIDAGDHVVINTIAYSLRADRPGGGPPLFDIGLRRIARGDVIAFVHGDGDDRRIYLKRAIGLPGETVSIERGIVWVDGRLLDEPYSPQRDAADMAPVTVPAGSLFVLGDNRGDSDDSRSFGPVAQTDVVGRAAFVLRPPDRVRPIR
jgi:signal peptidase I